MNGEKNERGTISEINMLTGVNVLLDAVCELGSFAFDSVSLVDGGVVTIGVSKFGVGLSPNRLTVGGAVIDGIRK